MIIHFQWNDNGILTELTQKIFDLKWHIFTEINSLYPNVFLIVVMIIQFQWNDNGILIEMKRKNINHKEYLYRFDIKRRNTNICKCDTEMINNRQWAT